MIKFLYFAYDNSHAVFSSTIARLSAHYGYDVRCFIEGVNLANPVKMRQFQEHKNTNWKYFSSTIIAPIVLSQMYDISCMVEVIEYNFSNRAKYKCLTIDSKGTTSNTLFEYFITNHGDWFKKVEHFNYYNGVFEVLQSPGYVAQRSKTKDKILYRIQWDMKIAEQQMKNSQLKCEEYTQKYEKLKLELQKAQTIMGVN